MLVRIKRQKDKTSASYWQEFECDVFEELSAASVIDYINEKLLKEDERIAWDCSCMQKLCGACAMVINGTPALACDTFIDPQKEKALVIEPLKKFPVICDLKVDRSCIYNHQKDAEIFLGEVCESDPLEFDYQYLASKCLKCGLCLEVCPNYAEGGKKHFGALMLNEAYLLSSMSKDRKNELKKAFAEHFASCCSGCMACREICPVGISALASSTYMLRKL